MSEEMSENAELRLRMRLRADDTNYASGVIPAATYMALMSDAGVIQGLASGTSAGFLARWESVDFSAVCMVGDFIEVRCRPLSKGNRSRRSEAEVYRLVKTTAEPGKTTHGQYLDPPELVARGVMVGVLPREDLE
ncbi:hotdog fold domain-containing protein [Rhodococcus opacus]|uniref:hotdog fold domain-containing protein n=1 Tax=Rhodococcus opacus TaxID=37919 RepID=UPI001C43E485|nr:hotdog fold domain-containing protein [Rhodococcus opacus]MBV6759070.1 hypothetical protein [Rhodococcus opacus]